MKPSQTRIKLAKAKCPPAFKGAEPCFRDGMRFIAVKKPRQMSYLWRYHAPRHHVIKPPGKMCLIQNNCLLKLNQFLVQCNATQQGCHKLKTLLMQCVKMTNKDADAIVLALTRNLKKAIQTQTPAKAQIRLPLKALGQSASPPVTPPQVKPLAAPVQTARKGLMQEIRTAKRSKVLRHVVPIQGRKPTASGLKKILKKAMQQRRVYLESTPPSTTQWS